MFYFPISHVSWLLVLFSFLSPPPPPIIVFVVHLFYLYVHV